ncbi:MAG TPA: hypothetical protein VD996_18035, partial [Chitinophagaceae bacterium]|nr:hypothetical protein [Chitinophagaceae bacterium]
RSDVEAQAIFDDVIRVNTEAGSGGTGIFRQAHTAYGQEIIAGTDGTDTVPACVTITVTHFNPPQTFPVKVVLDFGNGCTGRDGRLRKGKIITVYSGPLIFPGSMVETSFDGYSVNRIQVEGTHRVENKSTLQKRTFAITVDNGKLTKPDGDYSQWSSARTLPDNPLIKRFTCRWIVKGKMAIRNNSSDVAVIDYGNGLCNNKATITINGQAYEITLH